MSDNLWRIANLELWESGRDSDPVLLRVTETLYTIDVKAFDPYWNESHHEALGAMIDAGLIRPVKGDRR